MSDLVSYLCEGLRYNTALTSLSLRANAFTDAFALNVVVGLAANKGLCKLDLSANSIGEKGAAKLAETVITMNEEARARAQQEQQQVIWQQQQQREQQDIDMILSQSAININISRSMSMSNMQTTGRAGMSTAKRNRPLSGKMNLPPLPPKEQDAGANRGNRELVLLLAGNPAGAIYSSI